MPGRTPVIIDCDNTMGLARNEIDDGLAILMLLAHRGVDVVGITTTFGNGSEEDVYRQTRRLLTSAGYDDTPVPRGARHAGDYDTEASRFIADQAEHFAGGLVLLCIGPLCNLAAALQRDPTLQVNRIVAMGGCLGPLRFPRREVMELNLSSDPAASAAVLSSNLDVTLMSAQLCLQARYGFRHLLADAAFSPRLRPVLRRWFWAFGISFGTPGFYLWDLVAAWAVFDPDRFVRNPVRLHSSAEDLDRGTLRTTPVGSASPAEPYVLDVPSRIRRRWRFGSDCARLWRSVPLRSPIV